MDTKNVLVILTVLCIVWIGTLFVPAACQLMERTQVDWSQYR